jgi:hypothetical protein
MKENGWKKENIGFESGIRSWNLELGVSINTKISWLDVLLPCQLIDS